MQKLLVQQIGVIAVVFFASGCSSDRGGAGLVDGGGWADDASGDGQVVGRDAGPAEMDSGRGVDDAGDSGGRDGDVLGLLSITSVTPAQGSTEGGTPIIIRGTGFVEGMRVRIGSADALQVSLVGDALQVSTPPRQAGVVDIIVERPDGSIALLESAFEYVPPALCALESANPGNAADDIGIFAELRATFSRPIDPPSLVGAQLKTLAGTELAIDVVLDTDDRTVIVTPRAPLKFWGHYELSLSELRETDTDTPCEAVAIAFSTVEPKTIAQPQRGAPAQRAAISGNHLYLSSRTYRGVQVYNITDPEAPSQVGHLMTEFSPQNISVLDQRAYLAVGTSGVAVLDISTPENPQLTSVVRVPGTAVDAVPYRTDSGKEVIAVATGADGVRLIDVTEPDYPIDLGLVDPSGNRANDVRAVKIDEGVLTIANGSMGVAWADVTNPGAPVILRSFIPDPTPSGKTQRPVIDVVRNQTVTYLLLQRNFYVTAFRFDPANPAEPTLVSAISDCSGACVEVGSSIRLAGSSLMVSALRGGVVELPLNASGAVTGKITGRFAGSGAWVRDAVSFGDFLMAATESGPAVFRRDAVAEALWVDPDSYGDVRSITGAGNRLFAATSRGIIEFDIGADAEAPVAEGRLQTPGTPSADFYSLRVVARQGMIAVADGRTGFASFITDNDTLALGGQVAALDNSRSVLLAGDFVFACDDNQGFMAIDVSDPSAPTLLSRTSFNGLDASVTVDRCNSLGLEGNLLVVAARDNVWAIDVTTPSSPVYLGRYVLRANDTTSRVLVRDGLAYVAAMYVELGTTSYHMMVLDLSDPSSPVRIWQSADLGGATDLISAGHLLFFAAGSSGVHVFDVADARVPVYQGRVPTSGDAADLYATDNALYVGMSAGGIGVIHTGTIAADPNPGYF